MLKWPVSWKLEKISIGQRIRYDLTWNGKGVLYGFNSFPLESRGGLEILKNKKIAIHI